MYLSLRISISVDFKCFGREKETEISIRLAKTRGAYLASQENTIGFKFSRREKELEISICSAKTRGVYLASVRNIASFKHFERGK